MGLSQRVVDRFERNMPEAACWGIIGTGNICHDFCVSLRANGSSIRIVGARDTAKAQRFAEAHTAEDYGTYDDVLKDAKVTVVYIGVIHPMHSEWTLKAIAAGKHVVVEKPMTLNADTSRKLVQAARDANVFLMEAMWTRFFPLVRKAKEVLQSGRLGAVRAVNADFRFRMEEDPSHRLFALEQGGGAVLDIGCYTTQVATMVFGATLPDSVACSGTLGATGVDIEGGMALTWKGQGTATLSFGIQSVAPEETVIACEKGYIRLCAPAHCPTRMEVAEADARGFTPAEIFEVALPEVPGKVNFPNSEGMLYQVQHVEECLGKGLLESPEYPLDETLVLAAISDQFLAAVGVVHP